MKIIASDYEPKDIIKIIREWSELTQPKFGKTINRSERAIQDYESGRRFYNIKTLLQIAKAHNLTITIEKK